MTIRNDLEILSELIPSSEEYFKLTSSEKSPTQIWADRCKKTHDWAVAFFHDFSARKRLAHLNSVENANQFPYEGAKFGEMFCVWREVIDNLPQELQQKIGEEKYFQLRDGFSDYTDFNEVARRIRQKELVILESGFKGHSTLGTGHVIYLVFCKGYMLICNRGYQPPELQANPTITAYKLDPSAEFRSYVVDSIASCKKEGDEENLLYIYRDLVDELKLQKDEICLQLESLTSGKQKVENCASVNCKEALLGSLALLSIENEKLMDHKLDAAKAIKREISAHARASELQRYYQKHSENLALFDKHLAKVTLNKTLKQLSKAGIDRSNYPALLDVERLCPLNWDEIPHIGQVFKVCNFIRSFFSNQS